MDPFLHLALFASGPLCITLCFASASCLVYYHIIQNLLGTDNAT